MPKIPNWKKRTKRNKLQVWEYEDTQETVKVVAPAASNIDWAVGLPSGRKVFPRKKDAEDYAVSYMRARNEQMKEE